jgi:hypothetical protein
MARSVKAVYYGGAFVPEEPCDVPEDAHVELVIQGPFMLPPQVASPDERRVILERLVARMRRNPIPSAAPRWTRDELHDRR